MPTDSTTSTPHCGAPTRRGRACRNPSRGGGRCRLHDGSPAAPSPPSDFLTTDPVQRLQVLQDAAEHRALKAHHGGSGDGTDKLDAAFNRNARLAATIARVRMALTKGRGSSADGKEEEEPSQTVIYRLPDNGR